MACVVLVVGAIVCTVHVRIQDLFDFVRYVLAVAAVSRVGYYRRLYRPSQWITITIIALCALQHCSIMRAVWYRFWLGSLQTRGRLIKLETGYEYCKQGACVCTAVVDIGCILLTADCRLLCENAAKYEFSCCLLQILSPAVRSCRASTYHISGRAGSIMGIPAVEGGGVFSRCVGVVSAAGLGRRCQSKTMPARLVDVSST